MFSCRGVKCNFYVCIASLLDVQQRLKESAQSTEKRWTVCFIRDASTQFGTSWENLGKSILGSTTNSVSVAGTNFETLCGDFHYHRTVYAFTVGDDIIDYMLSHVFTTLISCIIWHVSAPSSVPPDRYDSPTFVLHELTKRISFADSMQKTDPKSARFRNNIALLFNKISKIEKDIASIWISSTWAMHMEASRPLGQW